MAKETKVLLVGWDAADWKMAQPLMDQGLMPNTKQLVEGGVMANLATLSPPLSPMLWTSIATGKRPFKHGILGFLEPTADGRAIQPVTNLSRKTKAVWNILNQNGKRCLVIGWWPSHPAEPIDGVMVSNQYQRAPEGPAPKWPMSPATVHPPALRETLAALRLHPRELAPEHVLPFVPQAAKIDQDKDPRLDMLLRDIADCTSIQSCATHLLEHEPWDFAAVYFDAIDHFGHGFMKYHPPRQPFIPEADFEIYRHVVTTAYVYHDLMLGRLLELAGPDTTVILMSDHGFHPDHLRPDAIPTEPAGPAIEHREFGIFAMRGPGVKADELVHGASVLDVAPTILTLFGLPVGDDMDGRPIVEAFVDEPHVESIPSWDVVKGRDGQHPDTRKLDSSESREMVEQLVALGYVERPSDDQRESVEQIRRETDYYLALSYIDAGMYGSAAPLLSALYQQYPLEFRFGIHLAMCLHTLGMTADMEKLIDSLNTRWRHAAARARWRLNSIAEIGKERRRVRLEVGASEGQELFNEDERRAIRTLRAVARGDEQTLDYLASTVAMAKGDFRGALEHLHKAQESETNTPAFHLKVGNAYIALKQYGRAEECFRRALALDDDNAQAYVGLCRAALGRRRNYEALEAAARAVALKYHFPVAHHLLGLARARLGDLDAAVRSFTRALSQNPNFPEAHARLAMIHTQRRDDDLARHHRGLARDIRLERTRLRKMRILPELPTLDDSAIDAQLPDFPHEGPKNLLPALAVPPVATAPRAADDDVFVTVVSGLPRSGTSMMMQMLAAGGVPAHTDNARAADENNPRGYFELEKIKQLASDNSWLDEANGKALKVVVPLVPFLPQAGRYRVVFMHRDVGEIVSSQARMLARLEREGAKLDPARLHQVLTRQVQQVRQLLAAHGVPVLVLNYADVLAEPAQTTARVAAFLGVPLDENAMQRVVDPSLHRERSAAQADAAVQINGVVAGR